ncbi:hypothetical protein [Tautonia marina]|uniref:hypothetical protein n=1 Tax=Tautonia marina TaxID=2653855 RepID=UPI0012611700|nr:hypothetical protein [Tautonia marina]
MRRPSTSRRPGPAGRALALASLALATGCTHNHYYGTSPAYVVPGETVILDDVCEIPSRVVTQSPSLVARAEAPRSSVSAEPDLVTSNSRSSRVVISRPSSGPMAGGGWNPLSRNPRLVTTEVQGGADESLVR